PAPERPQPAPIGGPYLLGRDEHARIVLGLKQDLDTPPPGTRRTAIHVRRVGPPVRPVAVVVRAPLAIRPLRRLVRLAQPEAGPEHPVLGIPLPRAPPLLELLGERRQLQLIRAHDRIGIR